MTARLSRAVSPAEIDDELAVLWRDAGRDGPVARARMANLVVFRDCPPKEPVNLESIEGVPIDEVAERHPSRVILLLHGGNIDLRSPQAATITVLLVGKPPTRFGIEKIAVRSACAELSLPSIVRRLALGDVPTSIWVTDDLSRTTTPIRSLVAMARQLVYDSRRWRDVRGGVLALAPFVTGPDVPDLADLNWRRLTPMRLALTQALAPMNAAVKVASMRLRIRHRPGDGAMAWLIAGWFSSRLAWAGDAQWPTTIEEARRGDDIVSVSFGGDEPGDITATMNGSRVLVKYREGVAPFSVAVPRESEADAVAAELRTLTADRCLRETLAALARRFGSITSSGSP